MCPLVKSASAITPIVFCASFAPCVNATHVPDAELAEPERRGCATPGVIRDGRAQ